MRRFPYLTTILICLNVLIFLVTFFVERQQRQHLNAIFEEVHDVDSELLHRYAIEHPDEVASPDFMDRFYAAVESGQVVDTLSAEFQRWEQTHEKFDTALQKHIFHRFGFKPNRFSFLTLISSMFLHAGIFHLLGNMLFLWLLGVNIEDYWGRPLFLCLYFFGGIFATIFFTLFNRGSAIPLVGASGAISALMGAFAVRFYRTKIRIFWFLWIFIRPFWGTFHVYAWIALGFWFAEQLFNAMIMSALVTGVAFYAHVGGFLFGLAAGFAMRYLKVEERFLSEKIEKQIEAVDLPPKMEQAFLKRDEGDEDGAIRLLREVLEEDPANDDARLELTRCLMAAGREREAAEEYESTIAALYEKGKKNEVFAAFLEVYEKGLERYFSAKMQFKIASYLASVKEYKKAVELFALIAKQHPEDRLAPPGLLKAARIFIEELGNVSLGKGALEFLVIQYPDHHCVPEARSLLREQKKNET